MTSYAKNAVLGPVVAPMTDKTKGSFGNKVDCAGANIKNNATAYLQSAGVLGTVAVGTKLAAKNPSGFEKIANQVATTLSKGFNNLAGFKPFRIKITPLVKEVASKNTEKATKNLNKTFKITHIDNPTLKKLGAKIAQNPKATVGIIAGTLAAMALSHITHNHAYKAGQIDQKYTDKANQQKALES